MKGNIFIIDAMVSIIILLGILIFFFTSVPLNNPTFDRNSLLSDQIIAVLTIDGTLEGAVLEDDGLRIEHYLNITLESNLCGNVSVYNSLDLQVINAQKQGCRDYTPSRFATATQPFVAGEDLYYARATVWVDG